MVSSWGRRWARLASWYMTDGESVCSSVEGDWLDLLGESLATSFLDDSFLDVSFFESFLGTSLLNDSFFVFCSCCPPFLLTCSLLDSCCDSCNDCPRFKMRGTFFLVGDELVMVLVDDFWEDLVLLDDFWDLVGGC